MPPEPLYGRVPGPDDAERRRRHSHAERGNEFLRQVTPWGKACCHDDNRLPLIRSLGPIAKDARQ